MKCKGCEGDVEYVPLVLARELGRDQYNAGPALSHTLPYCEWFENTPTVQILAYINVAEYKAKNGNITTDGRSTA